MSRITDRPAPVRGGSSTTRSAECPGAAAAAAPGRPCRGGSRPGAGRAGCASRRARPGRRPRPPRRRRRGRPRRRGPRRTGRPRRRGRAPAPPAGARALQHGGDEGGGRTGVHLPEAPGGQVELAGPVARVHPLHDVAGAGPAVEHRGSSAPGARRGRRRRPPRRPSARGARAPPTPATRSGGDQAVVDLDDVVASGAGAGRPGPRRRPRTGPGCASRSPSASPGTASTVTSRSSPASRCSCSSTTAALSSRWAPRAACCQSQPPQRPGPANGHGGGTRSGDGSSTSTASARRKRSPSPTVGDPGADPLARQRVPDEDDPAVVPGDAVAAVGDRCRSRPRQTVSTRDSAGGRSVGARAGSCLRLDWPRGATATRPWGRRDGPRSRSDERSCHGTLVTMTPGVNSSRPLSRSALWLCSSCSHQCADDVLGDVDRDDVARAAARGSP